MFLDEQLHRNRSASQGQVGVVESGGYTARRCPSTSSRVPWADSTLSSVGPVLRHHVVRHELLGPVLESKTTLDTRKRSLSTSNISLVTSISVLNSLTLTNPTSSSRRRGNRERPARGEVHYGDREELGPLEPPVGVAVDPVVLRGSPPSPWSVVVHGVVYDDDLTLHEPDRTSSPSTRRRVLPTPPAGSRSPTRTSRPRSSRWPSHLPGS